MPSRQRRNIALVPMDEEENLRRLLNTPPQPKVTKPKAGGRKKKRKVARKPRR